MADKKTTSNSGLFGQNFGEDLDFSQFAGPKLFTPAPLPPSSSRSQHLDSSAKEGKVISSYFLLFAEEKSICTYLIILDMTFALLL